MYDFLTKLKKELASRGYSCTEEVVEKVNVGQVEKLEVKNNFTEDLSLSLSINTKDLFEDYNKNKDIESIADKICLLFEDEFTKNIKKNVETLNSLAFDVLSDKIIPTAINYEQNKNLLKDIPHIRIADLAVIFRIAVSDDQDEVGTTILNNQMWERIKEKNNISLEDLLNVSNPYTDYGFMAIDAMIMFSLDLSKEIPSSIDIPIVLTNQKKMFGSSAIANEKLLKSIYDKIGKFVILPSSIHELLIISSSINDIDDSKQLDELRTMVHDVNKRAVDLPDILSYNIYIYDGELKIA